MWPACQGKQVPGFDLFWAIDVNVVQIESDIKRCAQSLDVENESIQARVIDYWILKFHVSCVLRTGHLLKIVATYFQPVLQKQLNKARSS